MNRNKSTTSSSAAAATTTATATDADDDSTSRSTNSMSLSRSHGISATIDLAARSAPQNKQLPWKTAQEECLLEFVLERKLHLMKGQAGVNDKWFELVDALFHQDCFKAYLSDKGDRVTKYQNKLKQILNREAAKRRPENNTSKHSGDLSKIAKLAERIQKEMSSYETNKAESTA